MGQGAILNSSFQNIDALEDTILFDTVGENFDILNNAAKRYSVELKYYNEGKINKDIDLTDEVPMFNLPKLQNILDITRSIKFSRKVQNWKGIVISINDKTFDAKLFDLNIGGTFEIGTFDTEDISPDDENLLFEGSIFYWSVGHYMENGQSVKKSEIRFQRLIKLNEDDFEKTKVNLEKKYSKLKERKLDNGQTN
jgi:hypothetical protein